MNIELVKRMLDACYLAKRAREMLPPLPNGVMPSYIQYIDVINKLERQGKKARVSDISDALNLPRPGVTRTVKEKETGGYLQKKTSPDDRRITYISITEAGRALSQTYDAEYFSALAPSLDTISEEDARQLVQTMETFYQILCKRRDSHE